MSNRQISFSAALIELKRGKSVSREGWNGKGMFVFIQTIPPTESFYKEGKGYQLLPYLMMKTIDDKVVPWLASQTDILAEDWLII